VAKERSFRGGALVDDSKEQTRKYELLQCLGDSNNGCRRVEWFLHETLAKNIAAFQVRRTLELREIRPDQPARLALDVLRRADESVTYSAARNIGDRGRVGNMTASIGDFHDAAIGPESTQIVHCVQKGHMRWSV